MKEFIIAIQNQSGTKDALKKLQEELEKKLDTIRLEGSKVKASVFKSLPVEKHTLGLIYLIYGKSQKKTPDKSFEEMVNELLRHLNIEQARMASRRLRQVIEVYTNLVLEKEIPHIKYSMCLLENTLKRFQKTKHHLTPFHSAYLAMALKGKFYVAGEELLRTKIFEIDPPITGLTPKDMLLYYYYGGMIYCGLKEWEEAVHSFEVALTVPASVISAIAVESYKKLLLVGYLLKGKKTPIPKIAANMLHRHLEQHCEAYVTLIDRLVSTGSESRQNATAQEIVKKHEVEFKGDNNMGLIQQCLEAKNRRRIQELTSTYVTIGLENISKMFDLKDKQKVEDILLQMIEAGEIRARISQREQMVIFTAVDDLSISQAMARLQKKMRETRTLSQLITQMDRSVSLNPEYVKNTTMYSGETSTASASVSGARESNTMFS